MKAHKINQHAYVGQFATRHPNGALHGRIAMFSGGVTMHRPRLYETLKAAEEAAAALGTEAVRLVAEDDTAPDSLDEALDATDGEIELIEPEGGNS